VVGGSLGGLFAAHLLSRLGWEVDVFEKVGDDLASRGAGIGTHKELLALLARLGIALDERVGAKVGDRVCLERDGRERHRHPWGHVMSGWASVYRPLKERFPAARYHFGSSFKSFTESADRITARFENGALAEGDLLIGADGLRSAVRAQCFPGVEPQYAGYVAWRGLVAEAALPERLRRELGNTYWMGLPEGEMFVGYPVPAREPGAGRRDWNWVWYRPTTEARLADFSTDASGRRHGAGGIPPPLVRADVIAAMKRDAHALLAPLIAHLIEASQPFFQAVFDLESPRLVAGRAALLGDAGFVARPHVGMGVTKAALDAQCLADSLAASPDLGAALARYDRLRSEFGRRCVARARRLGAYIEARSRPERGWTPEELDQRPERLLREIARELSEIPELAALER
jgi:2-polyprenyl-6-methoxyphenol hydroxylase-like FAD-dependent oxidoreductase